MLTAAQGGSEAAFATLWRDGNHALLRYLRVAARAAAEDVAAETWVQVVRGLAGFRGDERAWRSWLFTIARHRAIDEARRRSRHPATPLDELPHGSEPRTGDAAAAAMANLATDALIEAIGQLPPAQAEVILLRVLADLDNETVARIVGRSPGAVRIAAHRGLHAGPGHRPDGCNTMTGGGVWDDMPMPQWPADGELPPPGDAAFDALLDRAPLPGDSASELRQLAAAFGELYAAPVAS